MPAADDAAGFFFFFSIFRHFARLIFTLRLSRCRYAADFFFFSHASLLMLVLRFAFRCCFSAAAIALLPDVTPITRHILLSFAVAAADAAIRADAAAVLFAVTLSKPMFFH